jgi:hypothetical protein
VVTSVAGRGRASPTATSGQSGTSNARNVRAGQCWDADPYEAGRTATEAALSVHDPKLLLVFAASAYDPARLLAGVAAVAGGIPMIGCSTSGEIGPRPELRDGVVVVCLGGGFQVATAHASGLADGPRAVGESIARSLLPLPDTRHRVTVLLTDALAADQQELIRGTYGVLGATVPLIGGGAGDNFGMVTGRQFHGGQVLQQSVVAASIGSDAPIGLSVRHGWRRQGAAMVVTASRGRELYGLDDRPALDVYLDRCGAPAGIEHDPTGFGGYALTRPLAIARRRDLAVRQVLGADPVTRSLICAGGIPKGAAAWLASTDIQATLDAADTVCAEAVGQLGGVAPLALLVFDCAGRRLVLGDAGCVEERQLIGAHAGDGALAGFYTYGEIARTRGVHGYHNQTIVALALS